MELTKKINIISISLLSFLILSVAVYSQTFTGPVGPPPSNDVIWQACSDGEVSVWDGERLTCVDITCEGTTAFKGFSRGVINCVSVERQQIPDPVPLSTSCPDGEVLREISQDEARCIPLPEPPTALSTSCPDGEVLREISQDEARCIPLPVVEEVLPTCSTDQIIKYDGSSWVCGEPPIALSTSSCGDEQVLDKIVEGVAVCRSLPPTGIQISRTRTAPETKLYFIGHGTDALHTLNTETGVAKRVGSATDFGVGEEFPAGIASHNGQLYLVGSLTNALYTLNTETGVAKRVGNAYRFGVDDQFPAGIASHNGQLYLVGGSGIGALYTLNTETGVAKRVGRATDFGVGERFPGGLASHNGQLYLVGAFTDALYTLNTETGVATRVGEADNFGGDESAPRGLASHNGQLYFTGSHTDALHTLNTETGVARRVGSATQFGVGERFPEGLASHTTTTSGECSDGQVIVSRNEEYVCEDVPVPTDVLRTSDLPEPPIALSTSCPNGEVLREISGGQGRCIPLPTQTALSTSSCGDGQILDKIVEGVAVCTSLPPTGIQISGVTRTVTETKLYQIGSATDALYTRNTETGVAERVGNAPRGFGVREFSPQGLTSHNGQLYLVGTLIGALYTLNAETGVAKRVGNTPRGFGVNENEPQGLASHNGQLYLVGNTTDALYTLNTETGVAERVGEATEFGVGEGSPRRLASHNGQLYFAGDTTDALHTLNTETGVAKRVGRVGRVGRSGRFGVGETVPEGLASHNGQLYFTGFSTRGVLHTLNTETGVARRVGRVIDEGVRHIGPRGLASHTTTTTTNEECSDGQVIVSRNEEYVCEDVPVPTALSTSCPNGEVLREISGGQGRCIPLPETGIQISSATRTASETKLYFVGQTRDELHTLNTETGVAERVGRATDFGVGEEFPQGLASHNGQLYLVGAATDALHTLNTETGVAERVGRANQFGVGESSPRGLASHNGQLYLIGATTDALHTLNAKTGAARRVGSATQFGVGERFPRGLVSHNGQLYMVGFSTDALHTLNTETGVAERVGRANQFGVGESSPRGLASHNGQLYLIGDAADALYTLNAETGVARRVGRANQFGVRENAPEGLASHTTTTTTTNEECSDGQVIVSRGGEYVCEDVPVPTDVLRTSDLPEPPTALSVSCPDGEVLEGIVDGVADCVRVSVGNVEIAPITRTITDLIMVGPRGDGGSLYKINPETGKTTRVADVNRLTNNFSGLTNHNGEIYLVGRVGLVGLYKLNPETGRTTRVGRAGSFFGVRIQQPKGLASHDGNLYLVGTRTFRQGSTPDRADQLYILNTSNGNATRVGNASAGFGIEEGGIAAAGLTSHNGELYMVGNVRKVGTDGYMATLYKLDIRTGVATKVGTATDFGINENNFRSFRTHSLVSYNGKLYVGGTMFYNNSTSRAPLYTLNTSTGIATEVDIRLPDIPLGLAAYTHTVTEVPSIGSRLSGTDREYSNRSVCPQGSFLVGLATNGITCRTPN